MPGDELFETDIIAASDATAILKYLKVSYHPQHVYLTLQRREDSVLGMMVQLLPHIAAPDGHVEAVAWAIDDLMNTNLLGAVELARARLRRGATDHPSRQAAGRHALAALCKFAVCYHIHVLLPPLGYIVYSDKTRFATPLSQIPQAPRTVLAVDPSQYRLVRHDAVAGAKRPPGYCPAEATSFAAGCERVGDRVARAMDSAPRGTSFSKLHFVNLAVQPEYVLNRVAMLEDGDALTFGDMVRRVVEGVLLLHVLVRLANGCVAEHVMAYDAWRRLLYLGAGEMHTHWMAGLIGIRGDDYRGDTLDTRLREELRVVKLEAVRVLKEYVAPADAPDAPPAKLNTWQKKQLKKRAREEMLGLR